MRYILAAMIFGEFRDHSQNHACRRGVPGMPAHCRLICSPIYGQPESEWPAAMRGDRLVVAMGVNGSRHLVPQSAARPRRENAAPANEVRRLISRFRRRCATSLQWVASFSGAPRYSLKMRAQMMRRYRYLITFSRHFARAASVTCHAELPLASYRHHDALYAEKCIPSADYYRSD